MEELFAKYGIKDEVVAVGVSGGADSLALVLQAAEELAVFGRKVVALTVDHGLRPTSQMEAEYVAGLMQKYGIEHHILSWQGEKPQTGVEEAARQARYALIAEWCLQNGVRILLTAHHAKDQAETFLMRLQRGSGLEGLCGIREYSVRGGLVILRPLLNTAPEELRNYLKARKIEWVEDESNADTKFLRGRIRKFLPELAAQTGIDTAKIGTAVNNLQSAEDYIEQQLNLLLANEVLWDFDTVCRFEYTKYLSWHKEMKFRVLARLCRRDYIPRAESVMQLREALNVLPFSGATLGGKEFILAYGFVWVVPEQNSKRVETRKQWTEFVKQYQLYKNVKMPYKAKLAILNKVGAKENGL
ncbi:MAG: tRNA lysidine(34) synthetase TilS [Alphaproteobacteria bacterium]|nr:tRNA lysidine(34) synthetase TilS [Alphaproteobacteria bacterium]